MDAPALSAEKFDDFRSYLKRVGFAFEERPHQVFLARAPGLVVSLYSSGKVVIAGKDRQLGKEVRWFLGKLGAAGEEAPAALLNVAGKTRVGTDEAGKGDYFGPLVVAGVLLDERTEAAVRALGVRDSKELTDERALELASELKTVIGDSDRAVIRIFPRKYNELYEKIPNVNRILGWAHARIIEDLAKGHPGCGLAVVDQFSKSAMGRGLVVGEGNEGGGRRTIRIVQSVRGERDLAVACASVLARAEFLGGLRKMGEEYGAVFPKGASDVISFAREFVRAHGPRSLGLVAKLHFRTTEKVLGR